MAYDRVGALINRNLSNGTEMVIDYSFTRVRMGHVFPSTAVIRDGMARLRKRQERVSS